MMKKGAIFKKSAAVMSAMAVIQIIVFFCTAAASGVMSSINSGEEKLLSGYAAKGGLYLRNELLRNSALTDEAVPQINKTAKEILDKRNISIEDFFGSAPAVNEYLETVSEDLLEFIRLNTVNGTFIIIGNDANAPDASADTEYRGVFFKDSELLSSPDDYSDIMLIRGSSTISSHYNIPLDMNWSSEFSSSDDTRDYMKMFSEPAAAAFRYPNASSDSLGYWNGEFTVSGENKFDTYNTISYSVPLICDGTFYGVFGICLSPDAALSLLPATEAGGDYILVTSEDEPESENLKTSVQAFYGSRSENLYKNKYLELSKVKNSEVLYKIDNVFSDGEYKYCAAGEIGLYSEDSPFYSTKWMVLSTESETTLFGASERLKNRLISAVIISAVIGIVLATAAAKILFAPVEQLAEDSEDIRDGEIIPVIETSDYEIRTISEALNKLSESRSKYLKEMNAERERYITALQAVSSDIFDYDCKEDIFTLYHFSEDSERGNESRSVHDHFRAIVEDGRVCPEEDIPALLAFLEGHYEKHFEIRIFRKDGSLRWNDVNARIIRSENGDPLRVIASSADITKQKEAELEKIDRERRDCVTGLYKKEYGMLLAEKNILENKKGDYTIAVISLCGKEEFTRRYGEFCFNGAVEEIGRTALDCGRPDDIMWRMNASEIAVYMPKASSDRLWDAMESFISHISPVYSSDNPEDGIVCKVGVSLNKEDVPFAEALEKAEKAAHASEISHGASIEYYNSSKTESLLSSAEKPLPVRDPADYRNYALTDNIISYSLTMLGKASDMRKSVNIVFRKAIRTLNLSRIAMYDIVPEGEKLKLYTNGCAFGTDSAAAAELSLSKKDFEAVRVIIDREETITADKVPGINPGKLSDFISKFRGGGVAAVLSVTENFRPTGCIMFSCPAENYSEELAETMHQLSKIVSAYVVKSRAYNDSRVKSGLLSKMSDEIRPPVNEIIKSAENAMESRISGKEAEEVLKNIMRSADSLAKLIDSISEALESRTPE